MKKFLVVLGLLFIGLQASADMVELDIEPINFKHFWEKNGIYEQKILDVGNKIISANKLDKRIVLNLKRNANMVNASASPTQKTVNIYTGILPYFDNDDELAYVVSHEIAHCLDFYDGFMKWAFVMTFNRKEYEYKADLIGIDLMAKADYNPVAAICAANKVLDESYWDNFFFWTHPKGSKRTLTMYKYIYVKYPWAFDTDMVHNINYENFVNYSQKEINAFKQEKKTRNLKQNENL